MDSKVDAAPIFIPPAASGAAEVEAGLDALRHFGASLKKAVRAGALYARNNATRVKLGDTARAQLEAALAELGDIDLGVRRDSLTFGGARVLEDDDVDAGIPFRLFREGVRRLSFEVGLQPEELEQLIDVLARRPSTSDLEDDLVSLLWRANLRHIHYVTLDLYGATAAEPMAEDEFFDDIKTQEEVRRDLDNLLATIYQGSRDAGPGVRVVNVSADDLIALTALEDDRERAMAAIGRSTARAILDLDPAHIIALQEEIKLESDEILLQDTFEVLLGVLFRLRSSSDSMRVVQEIANLYDTMVLGRDLFGATGLARRVRASLDDSDLKRMAIARQLLSLFATPPRLAQLAAAIDAGVYTSPEPLVELLQALGTEAGAGLLRGLTAMSQPTQRRLLCDALLQVSPPTAEMLWAIAVGAESGVLRDVLYLAASVGDTPCWGLIFEGCRNPSVKVRLQAVTALAEAPPGEADQILIDALQDPEMTVRLTAVRNLVKRGSAQAAQQLSALVTQPGFAQREAGEQRTVLVAYATLAGPRAVPVLDALLNAGAGQETPLLGRLRAAIDGSSEVDVQLRCAAAVALSSVASPDAVAALRQGAKARSREVRALCERALRTLRRELP